VLSACACFTRVGNVPMSFCYRVPWIVSWETRVKNQAIFVLQAPFSAVVPERLRFGRSGLQPQFKLSKVNAFKHMEIIKDPA